MNYIIENNHIPVVKEYEVIVVGGGVAGVGAALAAKRNGCKTLLIEKSVMLGGLATLGHIVIYLPLCDGNGRKVIGGISEELLQLSIKYGYDNLPYGWREGKETLVSGKRYSTIFNVPAFIVALDEVMEKEGIYLLYDTVFSTPILEGDICKGIMVENKSGRTAYMGKVIVDATGDCDVMHRAGVECAEADNWLSYWAYYSSLEDMKTAVESKDIMKAVRYKPLGATNTGHNAPTGSRKYMGTNADEITEFVMKGRKLVREDILKNSKKGYSYLALPGMPQFRTTRRIKGLYELKEDDVFKYFDDSIGCTGDWRKAGPVYEIPYRSLISREIKNIITAGRTIAATGDTWEVTRVIPPAAMTGQAAGTAAAIAIADGCSLHDVPIDRLQKKLSEDGVIIHYENCLNQP